MQTCIFGRRCRYSCVGLRIFFCARWRVLRCLRRFGWQIGTIQQHLALPFITHGHASSDTKHLSRTDALRIGSIAFGKRHYGNGAVDILQAKLCHNGIVAGGTGTHACNDARQPYAVTVGNFRAFLPCGGNINGTHGTKLLGNLLILHHGMS